MSALQKAIRRGDEELALRAAATLLQLDAPRLWRRLGVIATEDVGLADLDTVFLVTSALAGKSIRARLGGEWPIASYLTSRMARAAKCRAADDLLLVGEGHPAYEAGRREFSALPTPNLVRIATGSGPLPVRAVALWYALGTAHRPSKMLQPRRGEPSRVFDELCEAGLPHTLVEIGREAWRRSGEVLGPFLILLCPEIQKEAKLTTSDDEFPPEIMIGEVPGWAYDQYSREGRRALEAFLAGRSHTARWVRARVPGPQRVKFLGDLVFRVEGQACRSRLQWSVGDKVRRIVDLECNGPHCTDSTEAILMIRADLPLLNEVRAQIW
jgi:hypothetical protein